MKLNFYFVVIVAIVVVSAGWKYYPEDIHYDEAIAAAAQPSPQFVSSGLSPEEFVLSKKVNLDTVFEPIPDVVDRRPIHKYEVIWTKGGKRIDYPVTYLETRDRYLLPSMAYSAILKTRKDVSGYVCSFNLVSE